MAGGYAQSLTQSETGVAWQPLRVETHIGVGYTRDEFMCHYYSSSPAETRGKTRE